MQHHLERGSGHGVLGPASLRPSARQYCQTRRCGYRETTRSLRTSHGSGSVVIETCFQLHNTAHNKQHKIAQHHDVRLGSSPPPAWAWMCSEVVRLRTQYCHRSWTLTILIDWLLEWYRKSLRSIRPDKNETWSESAHVTWGGRNGQVCTH